MIRLSVNFFFVAMRSVDLELLLLLLSIVLMVGFVGSNSTTIENTETSPTTMTKTMETTETAKTMASTIKNNQISTTNTANTTAMTTTTMKGTTKKPPENSSLEDQHKAIIEAWVFFGLTLIGGGIAIFANRHREIRRAQQRDKEKSEIFQRLQISKIKPYEPLVRAKSVKDQIVESIYTPSVLSESTMKRMGGRERITGKYLPFLRTIDEDLVGEQLMRLPDSLRPDVLVRCDTQVKATVNGVIQPLNMNKLIDFLGNSILIGQPPATRKELEAHWAAVWENKIGCMIWIGNVRCEGDESMWFEAYAPVDVWRTEEAVWPLVELELKVLESFITHGVNAHYVHHLELKKKIGEKKEKRHVDILHIDPWEKSLDRHFDFDDKPPFIKKIVGALAKAHQLLYRKPKKGEIQLSNMMIVCPNGIHQSITFAAMHILRQMWLHSEKARVEPVVKYVRQHRYMAWGLLEPDQLLTEIKIIYRSMKMIRDQLDEQMDLALRKKKEKDGRADAKVEEGKKTS